MNNSEKVNEKTVGANYDKDTPVKRFKVIM